MSTTIPDFYRIERFRLHEVPAGKKHPVATAWQQTEQHAEEVEPKLRNGRFDKYAVVLDPEHLVIDVDVEYIDDNGNVQHKGAKGLESLAKLREDTGYELDWCCGAITRSPGGGLHYLFKKPASITVSKAIERYPGLDFLSHGKQVIGAGSKGLNVSGRYEMLHDGELREIPEDLLNHLVKLGGANKAATPTQRREPAEGDRAGDEFNTSQRGLSLLIAEMEVAGYTVRKTSYKGNTYTDATHEWTRPGKGTDSKFSGLIGCNGKAVYYVVAFSHAEAAFPQNERISIFYAYAMLCHGGNMRKAADALYSRGFAERKIDDVDLSGLRTNQHEHGEQSERTQTTLKPQPKYKAFPSSILPSPLSELVVEGASAIGCDESFIALPLLSCVGAAVGNTTRLVVKKGFAVPPTVWSMIVGESGTAKSPAFSVAKAALQHHQKNLLEQYDAEMRAYELEREQYEAEKKEFRRSKGVGDPPSQPDHPKPKRCMVSDTTVEALAPVLTNNPRGVLLQRDELNSWFGSFNQYKGSKGADEGDWLSMFDGGSITVDRKGEGQRPTFVESALVSITGGIQPAILAKSMSREHRDSGLASRFLFASPPRRPQRWTDDEISETTTMMVDRLFIKLFEIQFADGESVPNYIGMSPRAKELFVEFFNAHHQELNDLTGDSAAAWSKLLGYVPRIALLFHIVEQVHEGQDVLAPVPASIMSRAIELIDWFKHETARVYAVIDESDEQRELRTLAGWIDRKHGGRCTPREIVQGMKHVPDVGAAELLAKRLVAAGLANWVVTDPTEKGGRPKREIQTTIGSTVYETL